MSSTRATLLIAKLTWKRLLRGRAIWFTVLVLGLPAVIAFTGPREPGRWGAVNQVITLLLAVLPPLHLATAISDEIDDSTFTYLWSRPIARWTLLTGKLLAMVPALIAMFAVALIVPYVWLFSDGGGSAEVIVRGIGGAAVGVIAIGFVAIGFGSVVAKYPLPTVIGYMLMFDLGIGKIPFEINRLSITHHARVIAGVPEELEQYAGMIGIYDVGSIAQSVVWALAIGAAWLGIALWRIRVAEYATSK